MKKYTIDINELMNMDGWSVRIFLKVLDNVRYDIVEKALRSSLKREDMLYLAGGKDFAEQLIKEIYSIYSEVVEMKAKDRLSNMEDEENN